MKALFLIFVGIKYFKNLFSYTNLQYPNFCINDFSIQLWKELLGPTKMYNSLSYLLMTLNKCKFKHALNKAKYLLGVHNLLTLIEWGGGFSPSFFRYDRVLWFIYFLSWIDICRVEFIKISDQCWFWCPDKVG